MTKHTILFLPTNPTENARRALDLEASAIQRELERSVDRDRFTFVTRFAVQPLDVLHELRMHRPAVVHFSSGRCGTGAQVTSIQLPGLDFEGPDGHPQFVSSDALTETFGAAGASVELVVFNGCHNEAQSSALLSQIDCVIGSDEAIRNEAARAFAIGFYGGLAAGESIAVAYKQGRAAIGLEGLSDRDRLHLQARNGADQLGLGRRSAEGATGSTQGGRAGSGRIDEFVDREAEIRRFCRGLDGKEKPVLVVHGNEGLGKTSLLKRMIHEVDTRRIRRCVMAWTDTRCHNYRAVMRKICNDLGLEHFKRFTDLMNGSPTPEYQVTARLVGGGVRMVESAKIDTPRVSELDGVILEDSIFIVPRTEMDMESKDCMDQLTDVFISDLAQLLQNGPAVLFFDAIEKMSKETSGWIRGELIAAIIDGRLDNLRVVLLGRRALALGHGARGFVDEAKLQPFQWSHILEYLRRRRVAPMEAHEALAHLMLVATQGHPLRVANHVESYLQRVQNRDE